MYLNNLKVKPEKNNIYLYIEKESRTSAQLCHCEGVPEATTLNRAPAIGSFLACYAIAKA